MDIIHYIINKKIKNIFFVNLDFITFKHNGLEISYQSMISGDDLYSLADDLRQISSFFELYKASPALKAHFSNKEFANPCVFSLIEIICMSIFKNLCNACACMSSALYNYFLKMYYLIFQ